MNDAQGRRRQFAARPFRSGGAGWQHRPATGGQIHLGISAPSTLADFGNPSGTAVLQAFRHLEAIALLKDRQVLGHGAEFLVPQPGHGNEYPTPVVRDRN